MQARPTHPNVCCSLPSVLNDKRMPCRRRQCRRISPRRCLLLDKMCLCTHTKSKCLGQKFSRFSQAYAPFNRSPCIATPTLSVFIAWATAACIPSLTHSACLFVCLFSCWHVCSQTDHNDATWATCSRTADGKRVHGAVSSRPAAKLMDAVVQHALVQAAAAGSARDRVAQAIPRSITIVFDLSLLTGVRDSTKSIEAS